MPIFYKINSQRYKELKEKKLINKCEEEKREMERKAKNEKLMLQRIRMCPKKTYKDTRSSILRNKAKLEKEESKELYNKIEKELLQDKKKDQIVNIIFIYFGKKIFFDIFICIILTYYFYLYI